MVETPALEKEPGARPLRPGRWKNLDTDEHARNSRRLWWSVTTWIAVVTSRYLLVMFALLGVQLVRAGRRAPALLGRVENALILVTTLTIACFAIGERGECARMTIAFLPLLAALPIARGDARNATTEPRN